MEDSRQQTRIAQFGIISATGIPPPRWSLRGTTEAYVTVQVVGSTERMQSKVCPPSAAPVWGETLPPLSITSSSTVTLEIHRASKIPGASSLISAKTISVAELIKLCEDSSDDLIHLPMTPQGGKQILTLSLLIQDLSASALESQIAPVAAQKAAWDVEKSSSAAISKTLSHIMSQLGVISSFAMKFAQIHPVSAAAVTIVNKIAESFEFQLNSGDACAALMLDVSRVLSYVASTESLPNLDRYPDLVTEILICVVKCVRHAHSHRDPRILNVLDVSSRTTRTSKDLDALQKKLHDLELQMSDALTLGLVKTTLLTKEGVAQIYAYEELSRLSPISMPVVSSDNYRSTCLPGTRTHIISQLVEWAALTDAVAPNVFWLFGPAGSGKSTISTTLANILKRFEYLGGFVFFNRDVHERSQPSGMIRTMAHQLALRNVKLRDGILAAIRHDPLIAEKTLAFQFEKLILEPVLNLDDDSDPVVFIIDALDEGGRSPVQDAFLSVLKNGLPKLPNFIRILITSRRDAHIAHILSGLLCVQQCDLNQTPHTDEDIHTYIAAQMQEIRQRNAEIIPPSWPPANVVHRLVERAHGLFIWASIACSYISRFEPMTSIAQIAEGTATRVDVERSLDKLYAMAIEDAGDWNAPDFAATMHDILVVVIMARKPLSAQSITEIIGAHPMSVSQLVSDLGSVLIVDADGLIRVVHPSFREYITSPDRCPSTTPWYIDEEKGHNLLAFQSLELLCNNLQYNPMNLDSTTDFRPGPNTGFNIWVPPKYTACASTEYASTAWIGHTTCVRAADLLPGLQVQIDRFYSSHFLHWVEFLSMMGRSRQAITELGNLHAWYLASKESSAHDPKLCRLVYDSWRFVATFSQTIEAHPLLVYETALPFLPKNMDLHKLLRDKHSRVPDLLVGGLNGWNSCLFAMNIHHRIVHSLAIGPTGKNIASASCDTSIRIWNWETGVETIPPFGSYQEGHHMNITAVRFSPDNSSIFSGSLDGTICWWDAETGDLKAKLVAPDVPTMRPDLLRGSRIYALAISQNHQVIAAGRHDSSIVLWDLTDLKMQDAHLAGHTGPVFCVESGTDGNTMASGSEDTTVRLWDVGSRECIGVYFGHTEAVKSLAFSPDMSCVTSGSLDGTIRVWGRDGGVSILEGHASGVLCVSYSPDGHCIASGGNDHQIRLWNMNGDHWQACRQFFSDTGPIHSVLFCDPTTLASGSEYGEVRVWHASASDMDFEAINVQAMHQDQVNAVAISHNRCLFASASDDSSVILWSAKTGNPALPPIDRREATVNCVAFSPDDSLLAMGSNDKTVRLFSTATGHLVGSIIECEEEVVCIAFSNQTSRLAVGLADGAINVSNTSTFEIILQLRSPSGGRLCSIAFSSAPGKICGMFHGEDGLGLMVWNEDTGEILLQQNIIVNRTDFDQDTFDLEPQGSRVEFTPDDAEIVLRYHHFRDGLMEIRVFDISTGLEVPIAADACRRSLHAQNAEIYRSDRVLMALPRDFRTVDLVKCWEAAGDVIMLGMYSGRVYVVDFSPASVSESGST